LASNEKYYSTGKAARLIGVSFRTLKRWIYSGEISAQKMPNGRYRIQESEINRIVGVMSREIEALRKVRDGLIKAVEKKKVAYLREL
jgi:putative resolvase